MSDTTKLLDVLEAEARMVLMRVEELRRHLAAAPKPPDRPERCLGTPDVRCALMNDEAVIPRSSFANPHGWRCAGCGYEGASAVQT